MKNIVKLLLLNLLISQFYFAQRKNEFHSIESKNDFETTLNLLHQNLEKKQLTIFADFDHQKNAEQVGIKMSKSRVIVFGNPKAGTYLMLDNPNIALDLPLKIAVIEDENNKVKVLYPNLVYYSKKYQLKDLETLNKMQFLLDSITKSITNKKTKAIPSMR